MRAGSAQPSLSSQVPRPAPGCGKGAAGPPARSNGPAAYPVRQASQVTLLEELADQDESLLDLTHGYPRGLSPDWITRYQARGLPGRSPAADAETVRGYFRDFLGAGNARLAPSCSLALTVALSAVLRAGSEVVMLEGSYDSHPLLVQALGGHAVFAARTGGGTADAGSIGDCCTKRTRAVLLCSPDNPSGAVHPRGTLEKIAALCRERGLVLIGDHCLAQVSPAGAVVPLVPHLDGGGLSWLAVGDTGKILGLDGTKLGVIAHPDGWDALLAHAQSPWYFQLPAYDLGVLASVLSDDRLPGYLRALNSQVASNCDLLESQLSRRYTLIRPQAGCFALVDARTVAVSGESLACYLRAAHGTLVIPLSWFPPHEPSALVRVSLSRPPEVIERFADVLNAAAHSRG